MKKEKLIKKGTVVSINIVNQFGQKLRNLNVTIGVEILQEDNDYVNNNGELSVTYEQVNRGVIDYMKYNHPYTYFMFYICH